ncbi:AAA domain-containing protein [Pseudomonas phage phiK7A1]|uniref:AAA domain-containing protein n=1 Tax=Pseudomonas phage phiK7A1 TaxID=2759194 RepID=A0A7H0XFN4_9CAUD|nr:AAA domain-containing protein [Pseudomonas phage phiK7A1]
MKKLYLIRGLPGSGKSTFGLTLADAIGAFTFEADHYHYTEAGVYDWKPENVHKAHEWCQWSVRHMMSLSHDIVVSNTFTTEKELKPYLDLATQWGYHVTTLIVEGRHGNPSVHGVPQETLDKMRNRFSVKL